MTSPHTHSCVRMTNVVVFTGSMNQLSLQIFKQRGLCVVICWKNDCMACRKMFQVLPTICSNNPDILFFTVEHDANLSLFKTLEAKNVPLLIFYRGLNSSNNPNELERIYGFNVDNVRLKINQYC